MSILTNKTAIRLFIILTLVVVVLLMMTINNTVRALNVNKEHEIHELEQRNNLREEHNKQLSDDNASLNDKVWHLNNLLEKGFDE